MSAPHVSPKRWLLTIDGALLNIDFVEQIYEDGTRIFATTMRGDEVELAADPNTFDGMRQMMPLNAQASP